MHIESFLFICFFLKNFTIYFSDLDVGSIMEEARTRWLRPNEIHAMLCNYKYFTINVKPVNLPKSNYLLLLQVIWCLWRRCASSSFCSTIHFLIDRLSFHHVRSCPFSLYFLSSTIQFTYWWKAAHDNHTPEHLISFVSVFNFFVIFFIYLLANLFL